jgi:hypothetical protein
LNESRNHENGFLAVIPKGLVRKGALYTERSAHKTKKGLLLF